MAASSVPLPRLRAWRYTWERWWGGCPAPSRHRGEPGGACLGFSLGLRLALGGAPGADLRDARQQVPGRRRGRDVHEQGVWRVLAELSVPSEPGNERRTMEVLAGAIKDVGLTEQPLERLKTAVAEATMNAMEHGNHYRAELPVIIEVSASDTDLSVKSTDEGSAPPAFDSEIPDLELGEAVINLSGEINGFAQEALDAAYAEADRTDPEAILLNFEGVDYINSTGIALIVGLLARARASKRPLLASNLSEHYMEIFDITRLSDFMSLFPDEESAKAVASVS